MKAHPEWKSSNDKKKKIRGQSITEARERVHAKKKKVTISNYLPKKDLMLKKFRIMLTRSTS